MKGGSQEGKELAVASLEGPEREERADGWAGGKDITCEGRCWPGSPGDSREKRTEEIRKDPKPLEHRVGPG